MKVRTVSIVIPVYNEEKYISSVLKKVIDSNVLKAKKEIILVDDSSKDESRKIIGRLIKGKKNIVLLKNDRNLGKGAALKKGFLRSTGDVVIVQDSDLEYSPDEYPKILKVFKGQNADAVYGSRFLSGQPHRVLYFWHFMANKMLTTLSNMTTNLNLTDMETGCKAFKGNVIRKIAPTLRAKRFGFEPEITSKISKIKNAKIYEIGISYFGRTYLEGKKITFKDGLKAVFEIFFYGFNR